MLRFDSHGYGHGDSGGRVMVVMVMVTTVTDDDDVGGEYVSKKQVFCSVCTCSNTF